MYIRKRKSKWQVMVRHGGQRLSKTFIDRSSCVAWAHDMKKQLIKLSKYQSIEASLNTKLKDLIVRYQKEFSALKIDGKTEIARWNKLIRDYRWLVNLTLAELRTSDFSRFKEERVKDGNIAFNTDLTLLRHLFKKAINTWGYEIQNPTLPIEKAKRNPYGRHRHLKRSEYKLLLSGPTKYMVYFLLGRNTGLRPYSELINITWNDVDDINMVIYIRRSKTNISRKVPLTKFLLKQLLKLKKDHSLRVFDFKKYGVESYFKRFKKKHGIENLQIYDCTRRQFCFDVVQRGFSVDKISRITGHKWQTAHNMIELYSGVSSLRQLGEY